jgi:hypothetical protein
LKIKEKKNGGSVLLRKVVALVSGAEIHPEKVWIMFASIGVMTSIMLYLYDKFILVKNVEK